MDYIAINRSHPDFDGHMAEMAARKEEMQQRKPLVARLRDLAEACINSADAIEKGFIDDPTFGRFELSATELPLAVRVRMESVLADSDYALVERQP
jgi:hypothetical protein